MPPVSVGAFDLVSPLGRGGMGEVWRGVHRMSGVPVAVKVLTGENARSARFRRLFEGEVRAVAALDHPGIVTVLDRGEIGGDAADERLVAGSPWLAMELASGGSLDQRPRPATWSALRDVVLAVLDALAHAHARGIVHRDLKPANALVCTEQDLRPGLKLSDFGLAWLIDDEAHNAGVCGTPRYMAPEQFRDDWRSLGPWTDLYALGCMTWELATGASPFPGDDAKELGKAHAGQPLPTLRPTVAVPEGFDRWLGALLEKRTSDRVRHAADAARALLALGDPVEEAAPSPGASLSSAPTLGALWQSISDEPTIWDGLHLDDLADELPTEETDAPPRLAVPPPTLPRSWESGPPSAPVRLGDAGLGLVGLRDAPLVGRVAERDALWNVLREVLRTNEPRAVVLTGPSGVGKSRLAEWLCERAQELGVAQAFRATHEPAHGPRDGLAGLVGRHLRLNGLDSSQMTARIAKALTDAGSPHLEDVPALLAVVSPEAAASGVSRSPAARYEAIRRLMRLRAAERPIVAWLDDVQWGAEAIAFATWLVSRDDGALPVLAVLTVHDEDLAERPVESAALEALLASPRARRMPLGPLPAGDCAELGQALGLERSLAVRVERRAGGNPLFAVEIVRDWIARGVLQPGPSGYVLRREDAAFLPEDLHALWRDRVAALIRDVAWEKPEAVRARARTALELAALLGRDVSTREWEEACVAAGLPGVPEGLLAELLDRRLATLTDDGWSFVHGMLRETIVHDAVADDDEAGTVPSRDAVLHAACAWALRRVHGDAPDVQARLGRHFLSAGLPAEAIDPLLKAATRAEKSGELAEAAALLELWNRAMSEAAVAEEDPRWGDGLVTTAVVRAAQGQPTEALAWAVRLELGARRHGWRSLAQALRVQATACVMLGNLAGAERAAAEAVEVARAAGNAIITASALDALADIARMRGQWARAGELYAEARPLVRPEVNAGVAVDCRIGLALVALHDGRLDDAEALYREAGGIADAAQVRTSRGSVANGLGEVARLRGRTDEAELRYREAVEMLADAGDDRTVVPRLNLALVLLARERWTEARRVLGPLHRLMVKNGRKALEAACDGLLATTAAALGDAAAFDDHLAGVARQRERTGWRDSDVAWALGLAADRWALLGDEGRSARARGEAGAQRA